MVELKNIKALFAILWLIILITLWVMFPFMPGDILFWMWLAIGWSILGLFVFAIYVMIKAIKYVILVGFVWLVVFVLFIIDGIVTHLIYYIVPISVAWIIIGILLVVSIILLRKTGKIEW
ncbi:MAG: hypothetical protein EU530_00575 [Promethearchaeota archaeon]|nr:MAG: hypothetical protein EU530_00575 [Candidatus Lokiarchaeota archaeon]